MPKTENQNRAWLQTKLKNYLWKIKGTNSYGWKRKQKTVANDLEKIIDEFKKNI